MKQILISEFKAKCIAIINEICRTRDTVIITRRGQPIAKLEPMNKMPSRRQFGKLKKMMQLTGDIVHTDLADHWDINTIWR